MTAPAVITGSAAVDAQASQAALVSLLAAEVSASAWPLLDPARMKATLPDLTTALAALVLRYGRMSSTLAARFYTRQRSEAGITGRFTPMPADPPKLPQVESSVRWATHDLWTPGVAPEKVQAALTQVEGVTERLVLNTGRTTILDAVQEDRKALGWARITEPGACSFCLLLGIRGAVYKTEQTASFEAHDHDRCHVQPVFTAYEPPADLRRWESVYYESTRGKSGAAARAAFRQAVEAERAGASG